MHWNDQRKRGVVPIKLLWLLDSHAYVQGLREMVEILESSKSTLEMEVTSVKELKDKVNKQYVVTSHEIM